MNLGTWLQSLFRPKKPQPIEHPKPSEAKPPEGSPVNPSKLAEP